METKAAIRKRILQKRHELTEIEVLEKSLLIRNALIHSVDFQKADVIYIYMDFNNEVLTNDIIEDAFAIGKRVAIPKIESGSMHFYYMNSRKEAMPGHWGILEPNTFSPAKEEGLVIVPGVAFDEAGGRIGYGKGYYDTFFQTYSHYPKLAIAFEVQMVNHIPLEEHDVRMEQIITEERIIVCQK
jgi:5-formyltetrahydrofolate cyclo-ligase